MEESFENFQKIEEADIGLGTHSMQLPNSVGVDYTTVWYIFDLLTGEKYLRYDHLVKWLQNTYKNAIPGEGEVIQHLIEALTGDKVKQEPFIQPTEVEFITKMKAAGLDIYGSVTVIPTQLNYHPVFVSTLFNSEDRYIIQHQFMRWLVINRNICPSEEAKVIQNLLDVLTTDYDYFT